MPALIDPALTGLPWTTAERVLMTHFNYSVIDCIYGPLPLVSLIALSVTCHKARVSWKEYKGRVFNTTRMLSKRFTDPDGFRQLQMRTGAVIIGEVPLLYFTRSSVERAVFDIAINPEYATELAKLLMADEAFDVWDGIRWTNDISWVYNDIRAAVKDVPTQSPVHQGSHIAPSGRLGVRYPKPISTAAFARLLVFKRLVNTVTGHVRMWIATSGTPDLILRSNTSEYFRKYTTHRTLSLAQLV